MPMSLFEKLGHNKDDSKQTNMSLLSVFSGEPTEAKGIVFKELTIGSKTMPTTFFVVDVKGRYNILLGRDWIHANKCIPSTLHQCVMQWVGDSMEVIPADDTSCVVVTESEVDVQGGRMSYLTGCDLTKYDYVSVGKDGFVPISVKPTTNVTRLTNDVV
jgi:hypothetical protein